MRIMLVMLTIFLAIWIWRLKKQNKKLKRDIEIKDQATDFFLRKLKRERNKDCDFRQIKPRR